METITCSWCGKIASVPTLGGARTADRRYCSSQCRTAYDASPEGRARYAEKHRTYKYPKKPGAQKGPQVIHVCTGCGVSFEGPPKRKFCSRPCKIQFDKSPEGVARYAGRYAESKKRYMQRWQAEHRPPLEPSQRKIRIAWNKGKTKLTDARVASIAAQQEGRKRGPISEKARETMRAHARRGPLNNRWNGGITEENARLRQSPEYAAWRRAVYSRDHFTCQACGKKAHGKGTLVAHHIKPWSTHPDLRFDVANGVTWCRECHASLDDAIKNNKRGWDIHPGPRAEGEEHGNAKLTEVQVREILVLIARGGKTTQLAHRFGVSVPTISDLKFGRTWKHLPRPAEHSVPQ